MKTTYYAFHYADGRDTTTGGEYGAPLHIAGALYSFSSRLARDAYVRGDDLPAGLDAYACRVPMDLGQFRAAVTVRRLPMGWRAQDARTWAEEES